MIGFSDVITISLAVFGVAWIIADSKISFPVRRWLVVKWGADSLLITLLECPPCLSFWLGIAAAFAIGHGRFAVVMAPLCTAVSLVLWTFVERNGNDE